MVVAVAMANNGLSSPPPPLFSNPAPPADYIENGRLYHGFRKGKYMLPIDEVIAANSVHGSCVLLGGWLEGAANCGA
ncbi:hypothetical protein CJF30_00005765 [Rutstroemia sp. NJR-2017a BBW]|nr:hypothetical protein CJF30_00005765 [Rutstroemia sp. NJR-2017a BBW]